jgi:hypothetical protein
MGPGVIEALWLHGGLAVAAGVVILLFPKIFFLLIGGFLVVNGGLALWHGGDILVGLAVVLGGILIFLSPSLVAWFLSVYLLVAAVVVAFSGAAWFLALPILIMAGLVLLAPKLLPRLIGIFLLLGGGLSLAMTFGGSG